MLMSGASTYAELCTEDLVALVQGGNVESYEEIIRRYQQEVFGVVSRLLCERARAEELVQQVFVSAYFALSGFERGADFGPWIRTIARNAVREELRKLERYNRHLKTYYDMLQSRLSESPAGARHEHSLRESLARCLEHLTQRQAGAVALRYRENKSFQEIAAILGSTSGAIRNMLCHVRVSLRKCIEKEVSQP